MSFQLKPEFNDADSNSRHAKIRELFRARGADSLLGFAEYLRDETDVYTEDEKSHYEVIGIKSDVRTALKAVDEHGLPIAGPTTRKGKDGAPIWGIRELFTYDDYCLHFTQYHLRSRENLDKAERFSAECFERYGMPPKEMSLA